MRSPDLGKSQVESAQTDVLNEFCHDLRQPLATVSALIAACKTDPELPAGVARRLRQVEGEIMQMSEMAERVMDTVMAPRPLDLAAIAREAADAIGPSFSGTIEFDAVDDALAVADEVTLRRALANLLENATRAAGNDGTVSVTVGRRGQSLRVDIEDSGPGFGAGPTGTAGLGLVIVDRLVRTHGGHLEILKSRLGGALMRLFLPAAKDTRRKPSKRAPQ